MLAQLARRLDQRFRPWPKHPIDRRLGIETSTRIHGLFFGTGNASADKGNLGYAGSQPSVLRSILATLPSAADAHFIDLGCGKGRMLVVAAEFPFARVCGIELVPTLAERSRLNAAIVNAANPALRPIEVVTGDATQPRLPGAGVAFVYLYNPFGAEAVAGLMDHVSGALRRSGQLKVFLIYVNPTHADQVDARPAFRRHLAERFAFSAEDALASPFCADHDSVVVWQSIGGEMVEALPGADREVRVTTPNVAAHVQV